MTKHKERENFLAKNNNNKENPRIDSSINQVKSSGVVIDHLKYNKILISIVFICGNLY